MPPHDLVFGLGPNCRNAWNLRRCLAIDVAYPFDWWITPAKSMLRMLEPDFRFAVAADDLTITPQLRTGGENSVYNHRLNILHHHDFRRVDGLVRDFGAAELAVMNERYPARFNRLHARLRAARAPLAVVNGVGAGWSCDPGGCGRWNPRLNGPMAPQQLVHAIRARLGAKLRVAIVSAGAAQCTELDGGVVLRRPATGATAGVPRWAEPAQTFADCYAALGLSPAAAPGL